MVATGYGPLDRVPLAGGTMTGTLVLSASAPLQITTTTPGAGKVLVSDSAGNASWGTAAGSGLTVPLALSSGQGSASILSLTNTTSAPSKPIHQLVANASGDQTVGIQVTGDSGQRLLIDSTGLETRGSGSGAGDVTWGRLAAGVIGTNGTLQGGTLQGGTGASGTLTLTSTTNATKGKILLGAAAAFDEANTRLGIGTVSPSWSVDVSGIGNFQNVQTAVVAKTSSYTATAADSIIEVSAASGSVTITLPTAVGANGRPYTIKRTDSTYANTVTVATTSSQTIDGAATYTGLYVQWAWLKVVSDGTNWIIVAVSTIPQPWQAMTLLNSWTNQGGANVTAQYRFVSWNSVECIGLVSHASISGTSTIAQLPAGPPTYRPAKVQTAFALLNGGAAGAYVSADTSGNITFNGLSSNTAVGFHGFISLDA